MTQRLHFSGVSDDSIQVTGNVVNEEFQPPYNSPGWFTFADGTIIEGCYNTAAPGLPGYWTMRLVQKGESAEVERTERQADIEGPLSLTDMLVVFGENIMPMDFSAETPAGLVQEDAAETEAEAPTFGLAAAVADPAAVYPGRRWSDPFGRASFPDDDYVMLWTLNEGALAFWIDGAFITPAPDGTYTADWSERIPDMSPISDVAGWIASQVRAGLARFFDQGEQPFGLGVVRPPSAVDVRAALDFFALGQDGVQPVVSIEAGELLVKQADGIVLSTSFDIDQGGTSAVHVSYPDDDGTADPQPLLSMVEIIPGMFAAIELAMSDLRAYADQSAARCVAALNGSLKGE